MRFARPAQQNAKKNSAPRAGIFPGGALYLYETAVGRQRVNGDYASSPPEESTASMAAVICRYSAMMSFRYWRPLSVMVK